MDNIIKDGNIIDYLRVDGEFRSSGIKDAIGLSVDLDKDLKLPKDFQGKFNQWLDRYTQEHLTGYAKEKVLHELDAEGMNLTRELQNLFPKIEVEYFSDGFVKIIPLD